MPVSLSFWRVKIGTYKRRKEKVYDFYYYLRRYVYGLKLIEKAKKVAEHLKANDDGHRHHSFSNGSSTDENSKIGNATCQKPPSSNDMKLNPAKNRSPSDINRSTVKSCSETGYFGDNGSSCHTKSPDHIAQDGSKCAGGCTLATHPTSLTKKQCTPVPNPSYTKPTKSCDLDELDLRYITIRRVSHLNSSNLTQTSKPDQTDGTSESYSQVVRTFTGDRDDSTRYEKKTPNPLPSGIDSQSSASARMNLSRSIGHKSSCTRVAGYRIIQVAEVSGHDISPLSNGGCSPDMANMLLLRSGDVEPNPGPNTKLEDLSEHELYLLADGIDPSDRRKVGLALEFTEAQIGRFKEDNIGNIMLATYKMLCEWLKTVRQEEARKILSTKLQDIHLVQLANSVLKGQAGDHIPSLTEEEIQRVIKEVKEYSALHHCQIPADPLNSSLLFQLDQIFTNLTLIEEGRGATLKAPLLYADLLKTKVNGVLPKRLLVEGEGGVGKTTLCSKIVWDWIHGAGYQDFKLVLLVLLRDLEGKTLGEIIKSYLPDDNMVTAMQLNKYVFSHQKDVFLVLDGLDELAGDLKSSHHIPLIILNQLFKSGRVLITSRRWRSDEIRMNLDLRKVYAFIAVEGFSADNLSSYVTKFFHPDTTSAEDLNRFISNNGVIRENMAPFPIYTVMLCIMWKDFDGERRGAMSKLQTFSQLFDEMIHFLVDHYLSKLNMSARNIDGEMDRKRKDILRHLSNIGCLALQGLHERRLVFTEEEFQRLPGSVDTGCQVGVLTKQTQTPSRRERRHHSHSAVSSVQFPHKLFQEYLSGMYLASLHNSNRSEYDGLMKDIIKKASEFRELLYFTSAQQKEVGLDIITRLIASTPTLSMGYGDNDDDYMVDIAYESQDQTVAQAVADHLSTSSSKILEIGEKKIPAHTVAGHIFIMNHRNVDLADFMCSSSTLRSAWIAISSGQVEDMQENLSEVLAHNATLSKIENLDIKYFDLSQRQSASRDLAQFICRMPHLRELCLGGEDGITSPSLHEEFYSTLSSLAPSAKIEHLEVKCTDLSQRLSASRDLAEFICKMPNLRELRLGIKYGYRNIVARPSLHEEFFSTLSSLAPSAKIETLVLNENLMRRQSAFRDLAQFICKMNHLKNLTLDGWYDVFYSTSSSMASTTKQIDTLDLYADLSERPSALRHLAQFLCTCCKMNQHNDDFYSPSSSMALTEKDECNTSSTVTDLTVTNRVLEGWLDCGSMFDNVKRITIQVREAIRCDVIHRIHLPAATELTIQTYEYVGYPASLRDDPTSLPNALHNVSSQLVKITFTDINIGNDQAKRIIQAFRSTHDLKNLRILGFIRCGTDERLDPSSIDSNDEHRIQVEIVHGKPESEDF